MLRKFCESTREKVIYTNLKKKPEFNLTNHSPIAATIPISSGLRSAVEVPVEICNLVFGQLNVFLKNFIEINYSSFPYKQPIIKCTVYD